jgi:hypothetical protein
MDGAPSTANPTLSLAAPSTANPTLSPTAPSLPPSLRRSRGGGAARRGGGSTEQGRGGAARRRWDRALSSRDAEERLRRCRAPLFGWRSSATPDSPRGARRIRGLEHDGSLLGDLSGGPLLVDFDGVERQMVRRWCDFDSVERQMVRRWCDFDGVERRMVQLGMARRPMGARAPSSVIGPWRFLGGCQELVIRDTNRSVALR